MDEKGEMYIMWVGMGRVPGKYHPTRRVHMSPMQRAKKIRKVKRIAAKIVVAIVVLLTLIAIEVGSFFLLAVITDHMAVSFMASLLFTFLVAGFLDEVLEERNE